MKASELMIGNYVRLKNPNKTIVKVVGINKNGITFTYAGGEGVEDYEHIKPIPLNHVILKDNGFIECNRDDDGSIQYDFGTEDLGIDVWIAKPCLLGAWRRWEDLEEPYSMINELPIRYVHELQNAMALVGIRKEITL